MVEKQNIEWKDEYLAWICGFSNAQDGSIFIGMNDSDEVFGLQK